MKTVNCPVCLELNQSMDKDPNKGKKIIIPDDAIVGDIFECPDCGEELELICLNPLQVAPIEEEK
jgi:lysine biosynthesis protein LysW